MRFILVALIWSLAATVVQADYTLSILHTNDFHAQVEPVSQYNSTCKPEDNDAGVCFGGTARLITAIRAAREDAPNPVLLDGGDQFHGTLFYTFYKGMLAAEMMNALGYDAITVGNHEFDDGPEVLRGFMDSVDFPVLMSNADVSREPLLTGVVQKSTVIERAGEQIGLIGLTLQDTDELASPGPNIIFTDPTDAVQDEVDKLTEAGVNKIIVLSHSGYAVDLRVAKETTGVDVIVGGHSNTYLSNDDPDAAGPYPTMVSNTAIVQAYAYGKFLGHLDVVFNDAGKVTSATGAPQVMDAAVTEDADIKRRIKQATKPLQETRKKVVAEASEAINGDRDTCRKGECPMGNAVADAMLARVADQGVEVALINGGGVRASIDEGPITKGEVLTVLPFQNTLSTFRINGTTLKEALENGVSQFGEGAGRFPQVAGLTFMFDPSAEPRVRVSEVMVGGEALDPDKLYLAVSNDFIRNGGDGSTMLRDAQDAYDFGPDVADVLADYLAQNTPFARAVDGRITQVGQ